MPRAPSGPVPLTDGWRARPGRHRALSPAGKGLPKRRHRLTCRPGRGARPPAAPTRLHRPRYPRPLSARPRPPIGRAAVPLPLKPARGLAARRDEGGSALLAGLRGRHWLVEAQRGDTARSRWLGRLSVRRGAVIGVRGRGGAGLPAPVGSRGCRRHDRAEPRRGGGRRGGGRPEER